MESFQSAEGCATETCVVSGPCTDIFIIGSSSVDLVASNRVPVVIVHQIDAVRKNCYCLDLVCFVGPNQ